MTSAFTIPNILSASRIGLAPVLVLLAAQGHEQTFLILLAISLLTDAVDGYLARRLHQTSELGVKLDSWGDLLTYITMVAGLLLLWPEHFFAEVWFLLMGTGFYLLPMIAGLFKFGTLPKFHTWAAKLAAVLIAPSYFIIALFDNPWPLRAVICFHIWVAIEEFLIVFILHRNQTDVPTFIHARNLSRRARLRLQFEKEKLQERRSQLQERRRKRRQARAKSRYPGARSDSAE
jgi:CDP-diacylglycerol---glycerol-3-phosphate 3-phosphatidyltransferase